MRTVDVVRVLAPLLMIGTSVLLASRRRVVRTFDRANADAPERAVAPASRRPMDGWWLRRLERAGVLVPAAAGAYWLRRQVWADYRAARRRRGLAIAAALVALGSLFLLA
jgi:hypothetical protein